MFTKTLRAVVPIAALVAFSGTTGAQTFQRVIGFPTDECAYSVENCPIGGGFVTVGRISPLPPASGAAVSKNIYVVRYDDFGADIWSRVIDSVNHRSDIGYSVRQLPDSGFIISAESNSTTGLGIVLMRLDPAGGTMWGWQYAGTAFQDTPSGTKVRELPDGTFTVVGRYKPGTLLQGRMIHVDPGGFPIWSKVYTMTIAGVAYNVSFTDLRPIPSPAGAPPAGYFVSGWIKPTNSALRQAIIMRTDAAGTPVATWSYALTDQSLTADGLELLGTNIVWSGRISSTATAVATSTIIARVSQATGVVAWARRQDDFRDGFAAVAADTTGAALVAGTLPSDGSIGLVKLTGAGVTVFANEYFAEGEGHDVVAIPTASPDYALTGLATLPPTNGSQDVDLVRTDSAGVAPCLWAPIHGPQPMQVIRKVRQLVQTYVQEFQPFGVNTPVDSGNIIKCIDPAAGGGGGTRGAAEVWQCAADWNATGAVDSDDFYDYLDSFFTGDADFDGNGATDSQDYFDYLDAFLHGC